MDPVLYGATMLYIAGERSVQDLLPLVLRAGILVHSEGLKIVVIEAEDGNPEQQSTH